MTTATMNESTRRTQTASPQTLQDYEGLVKRLAARNGEHVDVMPHGNILTRADKDSRQLLADAETERGNIRKRADQSITEGKRRHREDVQQARAKSQGIAGELAELERVYLEEKTRLESLKRDADMDLDRAERKADAMIRRGKQVLLSTFDPSIQMRIDAAELEIANLQAEIAELNAAQTVLPENATESQKAIAERRRKAVEHHQKRVNALEAEKERLEQSKLDPANFIV